MAEYIERKAALAQFEDSSSAIPEKWARIRIEEIPAADVVPVRHGRWARIDYEPLGHDYICSECGRKNDRASQYCPNCDARMDGDANG